MTLTITVYGVPAPQGSKRHVGNGVMIESSKKVKPWREDVRSAALDAMVTLKNQTYHFESGEELTVPVLRPSLTGPVAVHITFTLARPKHHYRTGRNAHLLRDNAPTYVATKPDLDKLVRSTLDALTSAGVYGDDSQVAELTTEKRYTHPWGPTGFDVDRPGAIIIVRPLLEKAAA